MTRTVLITGASSGFGKSAAQLFASRGWNVVATMRRPAAVADLARLDKMRVTRLDVQDRDSIEQAIAAGIEHFGKIDVLVNNAGFSLYGVFESITREKIQEQFDVNLFMPVIGVRCPARTREACPAIHRRQSRRASADEPSR